MRRFALLRAVVPNDFFPPSSAELFGVVGLREGVCARSLLTGRRVRLRVMGLCSVGACRVCELSGVEGLLALPSGLAGLRRDRGVRGEILSGAFCRADVAAEVVLFAAVLEDDLPYCRTRGGFYRQSTQQGKDGIPSEPHRSAQFTIDSGSVSNATLTFGRPRVSRVAGCF